MNNKPDVLVIDDNPDKRQLFVIALQMAGYNVRTAVDGVDGLDAIKDRQPDLVIVDVMMPRMNGYEVTRRLRAEQSTRFVPVILQSAARPEVQDLRHGAEVGALGFITDPTDLDLLLARARTLLDFKSHLDSCEEAALTDHLTELPNRRRFERQLEREIARTQRYGHRFCLISIDIDFFKHINDTYGHKVGDETLQIIANTLQAGIRGIDLAARIGGEEFAVLLPETKFARGLEVAERLRHSLSNLDVPTIGRVTASFGIAEFPLCARDQRELLASADAALYEAKRSGRNQVKSGTPLEVEDSATFDSSSNKTTGASENKREHEVFNHEKERLKRRRA